MKANGAPCSWGDGGQSQPPLYGRWGPGQLRNSVQFTPSSVTKMFSHVQKLSTLYFYILVHNFKNKSKEKNEAKVSFPRTLMPSSKAGVALGTTKDICLSMMMALQR